MILLCSQVFGLPSMDPAFAGFIFSTWPDPRFTVGGLNFLVG